MSLRGRGSVTVSVRVTVRVNVPGKERVRVIGAERVRVRVRMGVCSIVQCHAGRLWPEHPIL